jgi:ribosomal protein S12 methylthiotransferase accessory factor
MEGAMRHALLELIERDAACLWWRGGQRGHAVDVRDATEAGVLLSALRRDRHERGSWLLDITTEFNVPVVVAISAQPDGFGVVCGLASRSSRASAACAAMLEMCQSELADQIVDMKRAEGGDASLSADDRTFLRRRTAIDARACLALHPLAPPVAGARLAVDEPSDSLRALATRLAACGVDVFAVDLTRDSIGIPAVRLLAPALEIEPATAHGPRLAAARAATGYSPGSDSVAPF